MWRSAKTINVNHLQAFDQIIRTLKDQMEMMATDSREKKINILKKLIVSQHNFCKTSRHWLPVYCILIYVFDLIFQNLIVLPIRALDEQFKMLPLFFTMTY